MDHFPSVVIPKSVLYIEKSSASSKRQVFDSMEGMSLYQVCIKMINVTRAGKMCRNAHGLILSYKQK